MRRVHRLLKSWFSRSLSEDLPFEELLRSYILFLFTASSYFTLPFFLVINLYEKNYQLAVANAVIIIAFSVNTWVLFTRKYLFLRSYLVIFIFLVYFYCAAFLHNGAEYLILSFIVGAAIILEKSWQYFLYAFCSISGFVYIKIQHLSTYHRPELMVQRNILNMVLSVGIMSIVVYFFKIFIYELQEKLTSSNAELQAAKKEKERILQIIVHDLRSPINGISSLSKLLLQEQSEANRKTFTEMIHKTSAQSIEFINELLEMDSSSDLELNLQPVDCFPIIHKVVKMQHYYLEEKKQTIELHLPEHDIKIMADAMKLERVINNLLHNAIKFSYSGGKIDIRASVNNQYMVLSIQDSGIGIPEKIKQHLFSIHSSTKRSGTSGEKSYGLGLAICKQIIDAHKGIIEVETMDKKGTTFNIYLPVAKN